MRKGHEDNFPKLGGQMDNVTRHVSAPGLSQEVLCRTSGTHLPGGPSRDCRCTGSSWCACFGFKF